MTILSIPLRLLGGWEAIAPRQQKWERILEAARTTPRYRTIRTRLDWARHTARFRIDTHFADPVSLHDFLTNVDEFRSTHNGRPAPAPLGAPWPGARRALALCPWFPLESGPAILQRSGVEEVQASAPELICGGVETLRQLALEVLRQRRRITSMRWGVIAWSSPGREPLTPPDRALFWRAFGVPVWEQFRGFHGEILAEQCEAGDGWHLNPSEALWDAPSQRCGPVYVTSLTNLRHPVLRLETGYDGRMGVGTCDCGRKGARVVELTGRW